MAETHRLKMAVALAGGALQDVDWLASQLELA